MFFFAPVRGLFFVKQITEGVRDAVRACVERSTNSEGRIVEVNAFADFFSKTMGKTKFTFKTGLKKTHARFCNKQT